MLFCVVLCYVVLYYVMLCYVMLCYVVLYYVVLYFVMLYGVMSYDDILCYITKTEFLMQPLDTKNSSMTLFDPLANLEMSSKSVHTQRV